MQALKRIETLERLVAKLQRRTSKAGGGTPPSGHAANHTSGGSDPLDITTLAGFPGGSTDFLREDGTFAAPGVPQLAASKLLGRGSGGPKRVRAARHLAPCVTQGLPILGRYRGRNRVRVLSHELDRATQDVGTPVRRE